MLSNFDFDRTHLIANVSLQLVGYQESLCVYEESYVHAMQADAKGQRYIYICELCYQAIRSAASYAIAEIARHILASNIISMSYLHRYI